MSKAKASRLLSQFIRQIAAEATVPVPDAAAPNGTRMETRAEALARLVWKLAEGYTEIVNSKEKVHAPNKDMIAIILERMEGRVPTIDAKDQKPKASVADRVSEQSKERIKNALAENTDNSGS